MFPALPSLGPSSTPSSGPGDGSPPPRHRVAVLGAPPGSRGQLVTAQDTNIIPGATTTSATSAGARHKVSPQPQPQTNSRRLKEDVPSARPLVSTMSTLSTAPLTTEPPKPSSNPAVIHPQDDQKLALLQILNTSPLPPMPPHYGLLAAFGFELPLNPDQYPSPAFPEQKFDPFRENPWQNVPAAHKYAHSAFLFFSRDSLMPVMNHSGYFAPFNSAPRVLIPPASSHSQMWMISPTNTSNHSSGSGWTASSTRSVTCKTGYAARKRGCLFST